MDKVSRMEPDASDENFFELRNSPSEANDTNIDLQEMEKECYIWPYLYIIILYYLLIKLLEQQVHNLMKVEYGINTQEDESVLDLNLKESSPQRVVKEDRSDVIDEL